MQSSVRQVPSSIRTRLPHSIPETGAGAADLFQSSCYHFPFAKNSNKNARFSRTLHYEKTERTRHLIRQAACGHIACDPLCCGTLSSGDLFALYHQMLCDAIASKKVFCSKTAYPITETRSSCPIARKSRIGGGLSFDPAAAVTKSALPLGASRRLLDFLCSEKEKALIRKREQRHARNK